MSNALDDAPNRLGSLLIGPMGLVLLQLDASSHKVGDGLVAVDPHLHLKILVISFNMIKIQKN